MFNDLDKEIEKLMNERKSNAQNNLQGTIISMPGTEKIVLSTNTTDFMTCKAIGLGPKSKDRYCIVHKDQPLKYNGQYTDSSGHYVSIVPKIVFDTMTSLLFNLKKQMNDMKRDLDNAERSAESYKMTLDALRKNGVID